MGRTGKSVSTPSSQMGKDFYEEKTSPVWLLLIIQVIPLLSQTLSHIHAVLVKNQN